MPRVSVCRLAGTSCVLLGNYADESAELLTRFCLGRLQGTVSAGTFSYVGHVLGMQLCCNPNTRTSEKQKPYCAAAFCFVVKEGKITSIICRNSSVEQKGA
jgi:hypothetical protein